MNTYTWKVAAMEAAKNEYGLNDVVKTVHYTVDCTDGTESIGAYGSIGVPSPDAGSFKPYEELTESEIIEWVKSQLNVAEVEEQLSNGLELKKNPPVVVKELPWVIAE
jgi:hypothetical protein